MRNRFTTRNQWFTETIETIRISGLTLIISTMRFLKTFTTEFGFNILVYPNTLKVDKKSKWSISSHFSIINKNKRNNYSE
ncbi:MAG: hypothetical protein KBF75_08390 [Saprospiraceae bacterium]|nr:hypothetical protein [Saprospiraceae bacterium]HQW94511.1 hypothetical protein [Saprospiraceae bacterium]